MIYLICFFTSIGFFHLSEKAHKKRLELPETQTKKEKNLRKTYSFQKYLFIAIALIIPSALAGMRDFSIGTDVEVYGNYWFEFTTGKSFINYIKWATSSSIGFLYAVLNYVVASFTDNVHWFYFFLMLITIWFVYLGVVGFRDKISVPFAMFVYYILFYNSSLNILRQSVAIAIILFSYRFISQKQILHFLICWLIAFLFHSSAIVMILLIPIYFVSNLKNKRLYSTILVIGTSVVMIGYDFILNSLIQIGFLSERYAGYVSRTEVGGRIIRVCFFGLIVALILLCYRVLLRYDKRNNLLLNCMLISGAFTLLLFTGGHQIIRIAHYFDVSAVIMLPMLAKNIVLDTRWKNVSIGDKRYLTYLFLGFVLLVYWFLTIVVQNSGQTYPYVFGVLF